MSTPYQVLIHSDTLYKVISYRKALESGEAAGRRLGKILGAADPAGLDIEPFLEALLATKQPQIFAETEVCGDGSDWNQTELGILGDLVIAVPVTVFDDGRHQGPAIHPMPFPATLLFVPGALLRNGRGQVPVDLPEVTRDGRLDPDGFFDLYQRRLFPALSHASETAGKRGRKALVTIPGLGCGQFAGPFRGHLGSALDLTLRALLEKHGPALPHLGAIYFDPYSEADNFRTEIHGIRYLVRPLTKGNQGKPQLCRPTAYGEGDDDFTDCELFSVVAWDHVSWPGNDFFGGSRATDDGVKAAATSTMTAMTGVPGRYEPARAAFLPPPPFSTWSEVVSQKRLRIVVQGNLLVFPKRS